MCERVKEIGSYFDISLDDIKNSSKYKFTEPFGKGVYLSTCRSAIDIILKKENHRNHTKVALLPGFTCHAVVKPFINNGYRVVPYYISKNLEVNFVDLKRKIKEYKPTVLLIHDYFGFDSNKKLRNSDLWSIVKNSGITVINDQTQSMFSKYKPLKADYYIGSIRKWMGIPDGAYLIGMNDEMKYNTDIELERAKQLAMTYKNSYLFNGKGSKEKLLENYKIAEEILDSRNMPYSIADSSKSLISMYDFNEIKNRRQENGRLLLNTILKNQNLNTQFSHISEEEIPFYIPVLLKKGRKEFQRYLARNNVFATVIWKCPEEFKRSINDETKQIYDQILCIPCDQRYTKADMNFICKLINSYEWEKGERNE